MTEETGHRAFRCQMCDGAPTWTLTRRGDVVTTWGCDSHLVMLLTDLQRAGERTEIVVSAR